MQVHGHFVAVEQPMGNLNVMTSESRVLRIHVWIRKMAIHAAIANFVLGVPALKRKIVTKIVITKVTSGELRLTI